MHADAEEVANLFEVGGGPACQAVLAGLVSQGRRFRSLLELMAALEDAWSARQTHWMSLLRDPLLQEQQQQHSQQQHSQQDSPNGASQPPGAGGEWGASGEGGDSAAQQQQQQSIDDFRAFPGFDKSDFVRNRDDL